MDWNLIETNWNQFKGSAKATWNKINDYNLYVIAGNRDRLAGKIQDTYWISRDEVEKQLAEWQARQKDVDRSVS
jgi:uncharacterized protein YjbJ (UPF0337 family)